MANELTDARIKELRELWVPGTPAHPDFVVAAHDSWNGLLDEIGRLQERERVAIEVRDSVIRDAVRMRTTRDAYAERLAREATCYFYRDCTGGHEIPPARLDECIAAARAKIAGEST